MSRRTTPLLKAALTALNLVGVDRVFVMPRRRTGLIYTLHHVLPNEPPAFSPNRILRITPDFLEQVIVETRRSGFEIISLDEMYHRAKSGEGDAPFACFTFDDGYRDVAEFAYPILKQHNVPFTVYITSAFADGHGEFWWLVLEEAIARLERVSIELPTGVRSFKTETVAQKNACFHDVYWALRTMPEIRARKLVRDLGHQAAFDPNELSRTLAMSWDELRALNCDPLVTLGAHTTHHFALAKLERAEAVSEITDSIARLQTELGAPCHHFSYPYGDETSAGGREFAITADLGLWTAVTTQKGLVSLADGTENLHGLKRISLNGDYQKLRYLRALISGLPFRLLDCARGIKGWARSALAALGYGGGHGRD